MSFRLVHLKVKVKSLAAEAGIIRFEENKSRGFRKSSLNEHRRGIVRYHARLNQLAYGFLRGRSYHQMEVKAATEPEWDEVRKLIKRFGVGIDDVSINKWSFAELKEAQEKQMEYFDQWIIKAKTSFQKAA